MTFNLYIWHVGSSSYQGQIQRLSSLVKVHGQRTKMFAFWLWMHFQWWRIHSDNARKQCKTCTQHLHKT